MKESVITFECTKCPAKWQFQDGVDVYNGFAFKKATEIKQTVCNVCKGKHKAND